MRTKIDQLEKETKALASDRPIHLRLVVDKGCPFVGNFELQENTATHEIEEQWSSIFAIQ